MNGQMLKEQGEVEKFMALHPETCLVTEDTLVISSIIGPSKQVLLAAGAWLKSG
jgi:hypothetical protein